MVATKKAPSLGTLIDEMVVVRDERRDIAARDKELVAKYEALEQQVIAGLKTQKLEGGRGSHFTASIQIKDSFSVEESSWPAFIQFVTKKKLFHLLYRRVSNPACTEQLELGNALPGVEKFSKEAISLRKL